MALWDRIKESASTMQTQLDGEEERPEERRVPGREHGDVRAGRRGRRHHRPVRAAARGLADRHQRGAAELPGGRPARRFDENLNKLTADFAFGKVSVLQEIAKAKKKPAEARAVIQIGIVIGGADGDFDKSEQAVVREACFALDLPPHEFDL